MKIKEGNWICERKLLGVCNSSCSGLYTINFNLMCKRDNNGMIVSIMVVADSEIRKWEKKGYDKITLINLDGE